MQNTGRWIHVGTLVAVSYTCGHGECGHFVSSEKGWEYHDPNYNRVSGRILVCPKCHHPTFFMLNTNIQIPGIALGSLVEHLPPDVETLYSEVRRTTTIGAYTSAVMVCRKLLMHIAVERGAETNHDFIDYVDYLVSNHFAPPNSKPWVDKIRKSGNETNHEIVIKDETSAKELIAFLEMLLKFIYEFPGRLPVPETT